MKAPRTAIPGSMARVVVLIPARRHEPALTPLVGALLDAGFGAIVLVDDGSPAEDRPLLDALEMLPRVHMLRHAVNLGKGRALKTGINHFLNEFSDYAGLVTADADGQHAVGDIIRVATVMLDEPRRAWIGCRGFAGDVPLRSRLGNAVTQQIFHFVSGHLVSDTQTGLRAFPTALLPTLVGLPGERYEYEMTVLAHLCREGNFPKEIPISTIYIDNNRSSNFNPLRDSMRIYFVLLRFYASSLISAGLDLGGFSVTFWLTRNVLLSVAVGRVSSLINFALNRTLVFHSHGSITRALWRYYGLAVVLAAVSYTFIRVFSHWIGWNIVAIKVMVETILSLVSFSVQRTLVFVDSQYPPDD